ncbi:hypothetical protein T265_01457 [Opisthorchis viverrini]|uniref:Retrotransposon gag domain-containing protein n=1 Tax=Opisthorchis viverrini TaxID=6198 RepID=A0A074ZZ91_OPIVI|nr:hypothetical protein T265_01457 [Opisthorchis viverrini]KER32396.1 hypothetical protein T265_01457 [Opisthorchis viverrini]
MVQLYYKTTNQMRKQAPTCYSHTCTKSATKSWMTSGPNDSSGYTDIRSKLNSHILASRLEQFTMPAGVEPLDVNSAARKVEDYLVRFDIWCLTKSNIDDRKLTSYFLHFVGKDACTLIRNLVYPKSPVDISYTALKKKVLQHFKPINFVAAERARFNVLTRSHSQSVHDFVLQLQTQATKCDHGAQLEDQLHDRLIAGIQLPELQQEPLIRPDQKFQTIHKICKQYEDVKHVTKTEEAVLLDCAKTADVTFFKGNDLRPATGIVLSSNGKRMVTILDLDDLSCHRRHIDQVEVTTRGQSVNGTPAVSNTNESFVDDLMVSEQNVSEEHTTYVADVMNITDTLLIALFIILLFKHSICCIYIRQLEYMRAGCYTSLNSGFLFRLFIPIYVRSLVLTSSLSMAHNTKLILNRGKAKGQKNRK